MSFIINKKSNRWGEATKLYYLVENYREGKKVKRRNLLALSTYKSVKDYFEATEQKEAKLLSEISTYKKELDEFKKTGKMPQGFSYAPQNFINSRALRIDDAFAQLKVCQETKEKIKRFL